MSGAQLWWGGWLLVSVVAGTWLRERGEVRLGAAGHFMGDPKFTGDRRANLIRHALGAGKAYLTGSLVCAGLAGACAVKLFG